MKKSIALILFLACLNNSYSQAILEDERYVPETDSLVLSKLDEWQDFKFGLLMHWGPYSQWGVVESWSICPEDYGWCERKKGENPGNYFEYLEEYEGLKTTFNPVKFDPEKWAQAAKSAGMRYMIFTTKHHDGFSMFDSKYTDYKVTDPGCAFSTNPKANITKEVFEAFRAQDMRVGAYFSKPDWHSEYYWDPYWPPFDRNVNYDPALYPEKWEKFVEFTHNQLLELLTDYGDVDIIWLDGGWVKKRDQQNLDENYAEKFAENEAANGFIKHRMVSQDIRMDELVEKAREKQPGLIVVDRAVHGKNQNYLTPENRVPEKELPYPWESCIISGGGWSYTPDATYMSGRQGVQLLVDIVAKGGNLLLNIAPSPEGEWQEGAYRLLKDYENWMNVNSEAIYDSHVLAPYKESNICMTQQENGNTYFMYMTEENETVMPATISIQSHQPAPGSAVKLLGYDQPLSWKAAGKGFVVNIPKSLRKNPPSQFVWTIKVEKLNDSNGDTGESLYKNPNAPIDERVEDLLSRMTLEEKFWQLYMIPGDLSDGKEKYKHGIFGLQVATESSSGNESEQLLNYSEGVSALETAQRINEIQKFFVEETRLGIPTIPFDEALHGLIRKDATAFPQAIGLAASFNTQLMDSVAEAIATEVSARGIRQNLSPVINIARDVRWGRVEETYGEDPFLTSKMATSYINAFEKKGIITTPKHFVANVGDGGRDSYPIHFNERLLEEVYFPAFRSSIQNAGARSIMTAYNSLDGTPATANNWLLNEKLKTDWGFQGFVISDAGATGGANVLHFTAKDYAEATKEALEGGLDVIFQTSYEHYPLFFEAFESGMIDEKIIDNAVKRVLRAKFELGLFENPYVSTSSLKKKDFVHEHKGLAKQAALESIVLLKNEAETLPLKKNIGSIAVIGPEAKDPRLGGYSGPGNNPVSILEGLQTRAGKSVEILYSKGCKRTTEDFVVIPSELFFHSEEGVLKSGLLASYYNNITMDGDPALVRIDPNIYFQWTLFSPNQEKINYDYFSARWTGKLKATSTGTVEIGFRGDDGYRLYIDDELVIDNWKKQTVGQVTRPFDFEAGKNYDIVVEFYETSGSVHFEMIWSAGIEKEAQQSISEAVAIAKKADMAVVCVGIEEGEFNDRAYLSLPGYQEALIREVAKTGTPITVLLVGGSAITMENWRNEVDAIVDVWYPGDEGGSAIADILFGDYNPAGRLPVSFPVHESQLPLYYNHKPTGRGDDYTNLTGKPLFPFGFGLSYTEFSYSDLHLEKSTIHTTDSVQIRFTVTNTGAFDGDEVVQLYIRDELTSVARPLKELKGFQRIHLKKGETKEVHFMITPELLTMLDKDLNPVVEPGEFRLMIGASSNDIRLREMLTVRN